MKESPTVRTARVYDTPARADGTRVLVDRVWPRGLSRENAHVGQWCKQVAPSTATMSLRLSGTRDDVGGVRNLAATDCSICAVPRTGHAAPIDGSVFAAASGGPSAINGFRSQR
jgi:hypothetical protein